MSTDDDDETHFDVIITLICVVSVVEPIDVDLIEFESTFRREKENINKNWTNSISIDFVQITI